MAKELRCGDVMPGCGFVVKAETEQELMQKAVAHAKQAHQLTEITPEVAQKVQRAIRTV